MTAQAQELFLYKGKKVGMATEPLNQYLKTRDDIEFVEKSTAFWRGYLGQWEIKDNKLYLVDLTAYIEGFKKVDMKYLFPKTKEVFANWFTGEIRIPTGKILKYVHMGYESTLEKDIMLQFQDGVLISEKVIDNREEFKKKQLLRK